MIYTNSNGPIAWIYVTETTSDSGLSICLGVLYGIILLQTLYMPPLMLEQDKGGIGPENVIYIISFVNLVGWVFMKYWIIETKGLTDKKKKSLYSL